MIEILKASAGSGKTWNLAKRYLGLMLGSQDPTAYRHILAVTFTNKATDEMKSRILKELDTLARRPEASPYRDDFARRFFDGDTGRLQRTAEELLCRILHDYGAFAVSTIDRFFQQTLKAFAREIGQVANYQVELDKESLVRESVDRILDALSEEKPEMLDWLTESVMEKLQEGGRFNLEHTLVDMANALKSDDHREMVEEMHLDESQAYSKENLSRIRKGCARVREDFRRRVVEAAERVVEVLRSSGVDASDTFKGFLKKTYDYTELGKGAEPQKPSDAFARRARTPETWFAKKNMALLERVEGRLEAPLDAFCALFEGTDYKAFITARLISRQLYNLGIARELYQAFDELLKEKNVLSIDDSNAILRHIIDGTDAPFIYEKLGVRFEHFLLDEFQDTSTIQWDNFRPLLKESDDNGRYNLIVGDVKQSIYRWRGSDWNLLNTCVGREFPDAQAHSLATNWRSLPEVVRFNNEFFHFASERLDRQYGGGDRLVSDIYADVRQQVCDRGQAPGYVEVNFCDGEERTQEELLLQAVHRVLEAGGCYRDIAVLVRNNKEGSSVAGILAAEGIPVISDDSLHVKSSVTVRRLVSLLSYVDNPQDRVNGFLAESLGLQPETAHRSLADLAESLLRQLRTLFPEAVDAEVLYVQSLMDDIQDWSGINGNNLRDFLKHWADADPKIASPAGVDAVRVMTIHKSKGLEFNYVIFPYAEKVGVFKCETRWARPEVKGTALDGFADGVYSVCLSEQSENTLFGPAYRQEKRLQYIDNINTFYVALTRAARGLHVLAALPSEKCREACKDGSDFVFTDMSQLLYWHCGGVADFRTGAFPDFPREGKTASATGVAAGYASFPLGDRLRVKSDAADFFGADGTVGTEASPRLRGVVLHGILSRVRVPADLDAALEDACSAGLLSETEQAAAESLLRARIDAAARRGWFPDDASAVRNEAPVLSPEGTFRPDRVVFSDGAVTVVDYKFGHPEPSYALQVRRYMDLYRRMGYGQVRGYLWYVFSDKVEEILP